MAYARIAELQLAIDNIALHYGPASLAFSCSAMTVTVWQGQGLRATGEGRSDHLAGFEGLV